MSCLRNLYYLSVILGAWPLPMYLLTKKDIHAKKMFSSNVAHDIMCALTGC